MQIEFVRINDFRNLRDFEITFSELKTVLIGQNASGKSNFLEALVLIFKQLDFPDKEYAEELLFGYDIIYTCYGNKIKINRTKIEGKYRYKFWKNINKGVFGKENYVEIKKFKENRNQYLPKYIFAYYSGLGNSNRLEEHFEDHKADFARRAKNAKDNRVPEPARMLYAELIHSQLSLLSFFIDDRSDALDFLKQNLGIEQFQSVLLTIQKPDWSTESRMKKSNEFKFFGSDGVVRNLLYHLHDSVAFAPFRDIIKPKAGLWEKIKGKQGREVVYLYINDFEKIREYVKRSNWSSFEFFHVLNTANVSQLLTREGIKVRIKKTGADRISFRDLSEGEQQLLTVLGLMRFTVTDEALFLLDEPDTHLNPLWRWKYMDFVNQIVLSNDTSNSITSTIQVIMTSHDPLTIGSLKRKEIRIISFNSERNLKASVPMEDPQSLGVAGILTSDIFGLPSTLSTEVYKKIEDRKDIERSLDFDKSINDVQKIDLKQKLEVLNNELDDLGYTRVTKDPLYEKFQHAVLNHPKFKRVEDRRLAPEEIQEQRQLAEEILNKLLNEEGL